MKKLMVILFLACACAAFGEDIVIRQLAGTVEIKRADGADWTAAKVGDLLSGGASISTSFRSTAVLAMGNSLLTVRPLTKLTLEEFLRIADDEHVRLRLQTGRLKADVKPPAGGKTEFSIRGPMATASVRGTVFEMDTVNITVTEGAVAFAGSDGRTVIAEGGLEIATDPVTGAAEQPFQKAESALSAPVPAAAQETGLTSSGAAGKAGQTAAIKTWAAVGLEWEME